MRILILTSSLDGIASHAVPLLSREPGIEIAMVIYNQGELTDKKKHFITKFKKALRIGITGTLNGIRMRKWFRGDVTRYLPQNNLQDFCSGNNIPFRTTSAINTEFTRDLFKSANAELGISLGNSYIARSVFSICKYGMINIHGEILPDYQNAQSVIWQLYNGSAETGFTIHKINQKIDQGEILLQEKLDIIFRDTLHDTVSYNCAEIAKRSCLGLVKVLNNFSFYYANAKIQGKGKHYTTPGWTEFKQMRKQFLKLKKMKG